jgi:hypothetical protein
MAVKMKKLSKRFWPAWLLAVTLAGSIRAEEIPV